MNALDQNFSSLEQAVQYKTELLEKKFMQYQEVKTDIMDIQEEYAEDREDLLETIREMTKTLKLKHMIISDFVPQQDVERMEERFRWDEEDEKWVMSQRTEEQGLNVKLARPQSALGTRTHQTRHSLMAAQQPGRSARYKAENIITLELEMPPRTTVDYDPQAYDPQAMFDYGMQQQMGMMEDEYGDQYAGEYGDPNQYGEYGDPNQYGGGYGQAGYDQYGQFNQEDQYAFDQHDDMYQGFAR